MASVPDFHSGDFGSSPNTRSYFGRDKSKKMSSESRKEPLRGRIILYNTLGAHCILVTKTVYNTSGLHNPVIANDFIYHSHIWIHDNKIIKCRFQSELFQPEAEISDSKLSHLFGIDLNQIIRDEKIKTILL